MIGSNYLGAGRCSFKVWAPEKERMILHIVHPTEQKIEMQRAEEGYWHTETNAAPGTRYFFMPNGENDRPDPASKYQPEGVHGPSEVIDQNYDWADDDWESPKLKDLILYELHTGTFTEEGTFEAAIAKLDHLLELGVNAIEIMPVAQFPGKRNWGYDGVYPYAVQNSYGGPNGLKRLVEACHQRGIAVVLDVVYNHLGPEGNYLDQFGPYFSDNYKTPWGRAINYDGKYCDGVREFFANNATYWLEHFHIDGLRLDAIHGVFDMNATHFWELMHDQIDALERKTGRKYFTIAESDYNNPKVIKKREEGGFGFTAQWLDDFHHALYVLLHPEGKDRYYDFGSLEQLAKAFRDGFVHSGDYVSYRKRKHGASSAGIKGNKFVVFADNHDQSGNRFGGERLSMLVNHDKLKIAAAAMILSPYIPMLFMGEEFGASTPFLYFTDHSDEWLINTVREGRREEFKDFIKEGVDFPDPQSPEVFQQSKLKWQEKSEGEHRELFDWYKQLIALRQNHAALQNFKKKDIDVELIDDKGLMVHRKAEEKNGELIILFNLSDNDLIYEPEWKKMKKVLESKKCVPGEYGKMILPGWSVTVFEVD